MPALYNTFANAVNQGKLVILATIIQGPGSGRKLLLWPDGSMEGDLGTAALTDQVRERAQVAFTRQQSERFSLATGAGTVEIFLDLQADHPKLIIVGAVHIAIALVTFAKTLGFRTIVLDARSAFATPERFGHADQLLIQWPADALPGLGLDEATHLVFLTHDEKIDNPALQVALNSAARYVGALGSRKTHAKRMEALVALGVTVEQIQRIHAPIGLTIGAQRPEEIALAIMGEIVAMRNLGQTKSRAQNAETTELE